MRCPEDNCSEIARRSHEIAGYRCTRPSSTRKEDGLRECWPVPTYCIRGRCMQIAGDAAAGDAAEG